MALIDTDMALIDTDMELISEKIGDKNGISRTIK